uniref:P4 n=1 Tax=European mountain ash ringspot-associated virus (isolate Sorbus aucuparia) TaxID=1980426 RepID=A0A6S7ZAJ9_EMARV|nr:P4 [European mountain ash ringspot-associated virus]
MESNKMKSITKMTVNTLQMDSCKAAAKRFKNATWELISNDFNLDIMNMFCILYYACTSHELKLDELVFQTAHKVIMNEVSVSIGESRMFIRIYVSFHMLMGDLNELLHHGISKFEGSPIKDMTSYLVYGEEYVRNLFQSINSTRATPVYQLFITKVPRQFPAITHGDSEYTYMLMVHNYLSTQSIAGVSHTPSNSDNYVIRTAEEYVHHHYAQLDRQASDNKMRPESSDQWE